MDNRARSKNNTPNLVPILTTNDHGDGSQWQEQKKRTLRLLEEIQNRLNDKLKSDIIGENRITCENGYAVLKSLKKILENSKNKSTIDKCAASLREVSRKIELERNEKRGRHSRSPDSSGVVDLTSENEVNQFERLASRNFNNNQEIPDSTVNEVQHNLNVGDPTCYDVDSEVSSSQGSCEMRESPRRFPDNRYRRPPTLYSRRRGSDERYDSRNNNSRSTAAPANDPVQLILQTAKSKANCNTNKTDMLDYDPHRSDSSHLHDIDLPVRNERMLRNVLESMRSQNYELPEHNMDAFSRNSATREEIEEYEGSLKSTFFGSTLPQPVPEVPRVDDDTNKFSKRPPTPAPPREDAEKLSSMLEKMMEIESSSSVATSRSDNSNDRPSDPADFRNSSRRSSEASIPGSPFIDNPPAASSDSNNRNSNAEKEKKTGPLGARGRLVQEIQVVHKVGESSKINPSLKQLKSDVKKPAETQPRSDIAPQNEPYVDRGSSTSVAPADQNDRRSRSPGPRHFGEPTRKFSTDRFFPSSLSSSPASRHSQSPLSRDGTRDRKSSYSKSSHLYSNSGGKFPPRHEYGQRDDKRFPSPRARSPEPSTSNFRDRSDSREKDRMASSKLDAHFDPFKNRFNGPKRSRNRSRRNRFRSPKAGSRDSESIDRRSPKKNHEIVDRYRIDRRRPSDCRDRFNDDRRSPSRRPSDVNRRSPSRKSSDGSDRANERSDGSVDKPTKENEGLSSFECFFNNIGSGNEQKKPNIFEKKAENKEEPENKDKSENATLVPKFPKKKKKKFALDTNLPADRKFNISADTSNQKEELRPQRPMTVIGPPPSPGELPVSPGQLSTLRGPSTPGPGPISTPVPPPTIPLRLPSAVLEPTILLGVPATVPVPTPVPPPRQTGLTSSPKPVPSPYGAPRQFGVNNLRNISPKDPRPPFQNKRIGDPRSRLTDPRQKPGPQDPRQKIAPKDPRQKPHDKYPRTDPRIKNDTFRHIAQQHPKSASFGDPRIVVPPLAFEPLPLEPSSFGPSSFVPNNEPIDDFGVNSAHKQRPNFGGANRENSFSRHNGPSVGKSKSSFSKFKPNSRKAATKKSAEEFQDAENLKEHIKNKTEYFSPLGQIFNDPQTAKTGRGYGEQPKKAFNKFKIPKKAKPPVELLAKERPSTSDFFSPPRPVEEPISSTSQGLTTSENVNDFNAEESWDTTLNDDWDLPTESTDVQKKNNVSDRAKTNNSAEPYDGPSKSSHEPVPASLVEPDWLSRDTSICNIIDDEECWDPVDSPPMLVIDTGYNDNDKNKDKDDHDKDEEPVFVSETNNRHPEVIDICENDADSRRESVEITYQNDRSPKVSDRNDDDDDDDDVRVCTPSRSNDVIEIDSGDDLDVVKTPPRARSSERSATPAPVNESTSSGVRIHEVYSLENKELDSTSRAGSPKKSEKSTARAEELEKTKISVEIADFQEVQKQFPQTDETASSAVANPDDDSDSEAEKKKKRKRGKRKRGKRDPKLDAMAESFAQKIIGIGSTNKEDSAVPVPSNDMPETDPSSKSNSELIQLMMDYLKSLPDFSGFIGNEVEMTPTEFLMKVFPKLSVEAFTYLQNLLKTHEEKSKQSAPVALAAPEPEQVAEPVELQSTAVEPEKPKRGRKCNQKTKKSERFTASKMTSKPQKVSGKRHTTELDRLHADIEKMKHTKNNIFTIGEKRSCRSQPAQYSERYLQEVSRFKSIAAVEKKPIENESSSESGNEDTRIGIRRTRSTAELDSEGDTTKVLSSKRRVGVSRVRSKALVSSDDSDDSNDDPSQVAAPSEPAKPKHVPVDIFKSKPCPRRVKIKRFGAKYEEYESILMQKKMAINSRQVVIVVPKYPASCDDTETCCCHAKGIPTGTCRKVEHRSPVLMTPPEPEPESEPEPMPAVTPLKIRRGKPRRKSKPKQSKLRKILNMQVQRGESVSWQIVNKIKTQNSKKSENVKRDENSSDDAPPCVPVEESKPKISPTKNPPKVSPSKNPLKVSPVKDLAKVNPLKAQPLPEPDEESADESKDMIETSHADHANDEHIEFPLYNAFKDANMTELKISTVGVRKGESQLFYMCNTGWCNYENRDLKMVWMHMNFLHKTHKCNGTCPLCPDIEAYPTMVAAFRHMLNEHLTVVADRELPPALPTFIVKEEPMDWEPSNDNDIQDLSMETESIESEPVQCNDVENTSVSTPIVVTSLLQPSACATPQPVLLSQPVLLTSPGPEDDLPPVNLGQPKNDLPPATPARSKGPKIRVRRLSGDHLSGRESPSSRSITPNDRSEDVAQPIISQIVPSTNRSAPLPQNVSSTDQNTDVPASNLAVDINSFVNDLTLTEIRLMNLYKCSDDNCKYSTDAVKEFIKHVHTQHRSSQKPRTRKVNPSSLACLYCKDKYDTPEMLALHYEKYKNCLFQCAYCTFRAARPVFVLWHQTNVHGMDKPTKILVASLEENKAEVVESSTDEEKDRRTVVAPLSCVHCNKFETVSFEDYKDHWHKNHALTNTWMCHVCNNTSFTSDLHLKHLILHGYGEYQCVYCLAGAQTEEAIVLHLAKEHRTLYPKAVKRVRPTDWRPSHQFASSVEELDFDKSIESMKSYFQVVEKDKVSAVTLYKDTDGENGTVSATAIYVLNQNKGYVLHEEATKKFRETQKVTKSPAKQTTAIESSSRPNDTNYESVIAVDSSDDECGRLVICEDAPPPVEVQPQRSTATRSTLPVGLSGVDLYRCGFAGCTAAFEDYHSFKEHLPTCDNARNRTALKCTHCNRTFQQNSKFLLHTGLHAVPRFQCTLCDSKFVTAKKSEDHMKQAHKVANSKVIPANPLKDNVHRDLYIVIPNSEKGVKTGKPNKRPPIDTKNVASTSAAATKRDAAVENTTAKHVTTVYNYEEVEKYLPMQLFSEPVTCGICSTYNSKVRSNIIAHLKCHSTGLVPAKDITNPVPCIDKSELMFNKMTNHAAFSAKVDDKRIKCLVEKMEAYSGNRDEIIPAFVPKSLRFHCGAPDCIYISTDASLLKRHFDTLHKELNFNCPHCGVNIPAEKIHTHLRYHDCRLFKCYYCNKLHYQRQGIEKHQQEAHPDSPPSIQTIRELSSDEADELSQAARFHIDSTFDRDIGKYVRATRWKCNLCKSAPMSSEDSIKSHCFGFHRVSRRYKCCLCSFADDDKSQVNTHMNEQHESVSQVIVTVYKELTDDDDNSNSAPAPVTPPKRNGTPTKLKTPMKQPIPNNIMNSTREEVPQRRENTKEKYDMTDDIPQSGDLNLFILPLPNSRYMCPFCKGYNTPNRQIMTEHLCLEKNYMKYVCFVCGASGVSESEMARHSEEKHDGQSEMAKLTEDDSVEKQIEQILNYQQSKFNQVNREVTVGDPIMIESSDEEDGIAKEFSSIIRDLITPSAATASNSIQNTSEYACSLCNKVCTSSSGLKNHMTSMHIKKKQQLNANKTRKVTATPLAIIPAKVSKISPVLGTTVQNVRGVYPCPYCNEEFSTTETVAKHLCVCSKYKSSFDTSPIKLMSSDRMYACSYCGVRSSSTEIADHVSNCKSKPSRSKQIICCQVCSYEGDDQSMAKHIKAKHERMECLNCSKILVGSDDLEHHVRLSVINISGAADDCIPVEKEVVFMCPYCPTGSRGQTYDKYVYISNHIDSKHLSASKPQNIMVKINNSRRELLPIEIAMMQNKMNKEQTKTLNLQSIIPTKRRNVAVKSTSRISTPSMANTRNVLQLSPVKILRLSESDPLADSSSDESAPRARFNIVHARRL